MPRLPRITVEGAVYFITCRGQHNQEIFKDERDYAMFLDLLKKYNDQYDIKIFAYCLMPDHLHLLIEMAATGKPGAPAVKSQEMSEFMHNLNNAYTKYFNSRYDRQGHLFRERFKAAVVEKAEYLLKMTVYMHLNPQKLNLIPDARTYPYSSYPLYLGHPEQAAGDIDIKNEIAEIFSLLGATAYSDFVNTMTTDDAEFLHKKLARGGILGSDSFVSRVRNEIEAYQSPEEKSEEEAAHRYRLFVTTAGLVLIVAVGLSAGTYFYYVHKKPVVIRETKIIKVPAMADPMDLDNTEWEIKVSPVSGGLESADTLKFIAGKLISVKLASRGFTSANYSVIKEGDSRLVFETMQSTSGQTATWRGELENGKINGVFSLREEGKAPQDFSFISTKYRRKE